MQAAAGSMHTWLLSLRTSESEGGAASPPPQGVITLKPASKDEPDGATVYDEFLPLPLAAVRPCMPPPPPSPPSHIRAQLSWSDGRSCVPQRMPEACASKALVLVTLSLRLKLKGSAAVGRSD